VRAAGPGAPEKVDALVATFASRALRGRRRAWSLLFEPVDPAVEAERLRFRVSYVALGEAVLREGIAAGELTSQRPEITAAAVVGAIAEALVGRLTPPVGDDDASARATGDHAVTDTDVVTEIQLVCRRAVGACPMTTTQPASGAAAAPRPAPAPRGHATHEVFNQAPPRTDINEYTSNSALVEAVERYGGGWAAPQLTEVGALVGSARFQD